MPRIKDEILECSIYLYASHGDASEGIARGGSGLIVSIRSECVEGFTHCYFVTNQHVIANRFSVVRAVGTRGEGRIWAYNPEDWEPHPDGDDLAACPVDLWREPPTFRALQEELFITPKVAADNDVGIGDDVFMVSRLLGYDGKERNTPIVRFGNLAMGRTTRVEQGPPRGGVRQESYIVEMRSICGCSGSPVFWLKHNEPSAMGTKGVQFTTRILLLGVNYGHLSDTVPVLAEGSPTSMKVELGSAMATVVPAWKLKELLAADRFKDQRLVSDIEEMKRREMKPLAILDGDAEKPSDGCE